ncbi:MAG: type VI secretion system baseplate subunit TssG [Burkholderiaceae bacterium]
MKPNQEQLAAIESYDLLTAIAALDRLGRLRGFRPLDSRDGQPRSQDDRSTVLLKGEVSLGFAGRDVHQVSEAPSSGEAYALSSPAFALAGSMGPLPLAIAEDLLAHAAKGDRAGLDFLDLFHGRLLRVFYLIRKRSRPALGAATGRQTAQARMVRQLTHIPEGQWLRHSGLQSGLPQSTGSLSHLLSERLQTTLSVTGLQGAWESILGAASPAVSRKPRLGESLVLGTRYWNSTASILIQTPPISAAHLSQWLPGGSRYVMLKTLLNEVLQKAMTVRICIPPDGSTVPPARLGGGQPVRLGQSAWLKTRNDTVELPNVRLCLSGQIHGC